MGVDSINLRRTTLTILTLLCTAPAIAVEPLFGGQFESGTFLGWTPGGIKGGYATLAPEGTCFSFNDTTQLTIDGNYAALLRSNRQGDQDSSGFITSDPFVAGHGISFSALTENQDRSKTNRPATLTISFLDAADNQELMTHEILVTSVVQLAPGCPSEPRNGSPVIHFVDSTPLAGREVRVRFKQHTNVSGQGFFTLIDQVAVWAVGESPIFPGRPVAIAGTSLNSRGDLQLDASASFHPIGAPLRYRWYIPGEPIPRVGISVDIDDLSPGEYEVVLYVTDGINFVSDKLKVGIRGDGAIGNDDDSPTDPDDGEDSEAGNGDGETEQTTSTN